MFLKWIKEGIQVTCIHLRGKLRNAFHCFVYTRRFVKMFQFFTSLRHFLQVFRHDFLHLQTRFQFFFSINFGTVKLDNLKVFSSEVSAAHRLCFSVISTLKGRWILWLIYIFRPLQKAHQILLCSPLLLVGRTPINRVISSTPIIED